MATQSQHTAFAYDARSVPEAQGARIHWCELPSAGASEQRPLLLLHGLHDSHLSWQHLAPALAEGRRVLMPDLFGCGLSDRPDASYALRWHAGTIARWLQGLGVREVDVVGHSFGGGVAQMLLLEPEVRVRRLALLASGGLGRDVGVWLRLATLPFIEHFGQPFMAHGTRLALRYLHPGRSAEHIDRLSEMNAREHTARAFARTVRDVVDWRGQTRAIAQHAHEISVLPPTAVYWGDRDEIIPMTHGLAFARSVKNVSFHCIQGAGHWLHDDKPEEVTKLLRTFLAAGEKARRASEASALAARARARAAIVRPTADRLLTLRERQLASYALPPEPEWRTPCPSTPSISKTAAAKARSSSPRSSGGQASP